MDFTPNCRDTAGAPLNTVENCPDHGPAVAAAARAIASSFTAPLAGVYAGGVAGHDHVIAVPGAERSSAFNVATLVIFTNWAAAVYNSGTPFTG